MATGVVADRIVTMNSLETTLSAQLDAAAVKTRTARHHPWRFLIASLLAGAYVGIAVVLMVSAAGPFAQVGGAGVKLISGAVFSVALVLVVFAGGELSTSAMMTLSQGAMARRIGWVEALGTLVACFAGNLVGSLVFGATVVFSGSMAPGSAPAAMVGQLLESKALAGAGDLFLRGVLCNILVCAAVWSATRMQSEVGKAIVIFWCVFAFITSGFEHVVANMTTYALGLFGGMEAATWFDFGRNLLWVGLGNLVGGGLIVGGGYLIIGRTPDHPSRSSESSAEALTDS